MKKLQFWIGNNKQDLNLKTAPCEVGLVRVTGISDAAVRVLVEVPVRKRDDFMDWAVNHGIQFLMVGLVIEDECGNRVEYDAAAAEDSYGWMRSTDIDFLDLTHHSDAIIAASFIDQVN
jgi:hypothetical protein